MSELSDIFINNIAPILLIALIGYLLADRLEIDSRSLGRMIFNIFSPALVFYSLATTTVSAQELVQIFLAVVLYTVGLALVAYPLIYWQTPDKLERAGFVLCALTANNGNYGLPLLNLAFGDVVFERGVVVFVSMTIVTYTFGVYIASSGQQRPRDALMSIFRVPLVYIALGGVLLNQLHVVLPAPILDSLVILKGATFPTMLILLGMQLRHAKLANLRRVGLTTALRLVISPLLAMIVVGVLALPPAGMVALIILAGMPVAVVTTIFAVEFELNKEQISGAVLLSTLLSPVTLSLIILLIRQTIYPTGG